MTLPLAHRLLLDLHAMFGRVDIYRNIKGGWCAEIEMPVRGDSRALVFTSHGETVASAIEHLALGLVADGYAVRNVV